ncbi:Hydrogenase maturation protein HypF [Georgfuchsia toluolica]|uniref:Hydrogenase maturation protein HypF n=1 Tax=Georgfuchsia toluolica TaxID=424218 RepID=A0A916N983_9PROT|nr:carbamoyltransferase HypF [Georgfuchsia toluolica]CAG4883570.1 Hydrogenase maturation protein HypF [Georgfuchsia toluolica]
MGAVMPPPACVEHRLSTYSDGPPVLGCGAWFKNTLCVIRNGEAYVSRSVGNLDNAAACLAHENAARELLDWLAGVGNVPPAAIGHDLHPNFHSTRFALDLAQKLGIRAFAVQHHHAHIAALCAEHGVRQPVLGLALDGVGLGSDGTAWGGELLRVDGADFERRGHLRPLRLPGGDCAAREPWRMAASLLCDMGRSAEIATRFAAQPAAAELAQMIERDVNCPPTTSMGRVFDVAAGLLGLCPVMRFDAEAALALEQAATGYITRHGLPAPLAEGWRIDGGVLDLLPLFAVLADLKGIDHAGHGAALFHATLVAALDDWTGQIAALSGIRIVALGGGCFFNRLLSAGLRERLQRRGFTVLEASQPGPGDTAIALGQAWVVQRILEEL